MHNRDYMDLGRLMDTIFRATEEFTNTFGGFDFEVRKNTEGRDYYAAYPFPPANIYMTPDKTIVFEFALAGYSESDVSLQFQGDHMILSARAPHHAVDNEEVIFFNRRLKYRAIDDQRYYVPDDKYDREQARAVFRNGILRVTIPPRDQIQNPAGVKIEIVNEEDA